MTSTLHNTGTFKLPRIRTKDELLKSSPDIAQLLGETFEGEDAFSIPAGRDHMLQTRRAATSMHPRRTNTQSIETPRNFEEDGGGGDHTLLVELEEVKRERNILMSTIAQFKRSSGSAGGEAQENDIRQLMKELELKKQRLNELRQESRRKEREFADALNTSSDCEKLMKSNQVCLQDYIHHLHDEMGAVREDLVEVEAKNRLYTLLGERTRQEHLASEQRVRESRELRKACRDDVCSLSRVYHETCTLREEAEKQLAHLRKMNREVQTDWQRKLQDRRKEVREIRRRQLKDQERETKNTLRKREKEQVELELKDKREKERKEEEEKIKMLIPRVQSLETKWNQLCSVSNANSVEGIISYWQALETKCTAMKELVKRKEQCEEEAKNELQDLENKQISLLEKSTGSANGLDVDPNKRDAMERGIENSASMERGDTVNATKHDQACQAVGIRTAQGLRLLLATLNHALNSADAANAEDPSGAFSANTTSGLSVKESLPFLFQAVADQIQPLQANESTKMVRDQNPTTEKTTKEDIVRQTAAPLKTMNKRLNGCSFKRAKETVGDNFFSDVSKLVGFVEEAENVYSEEDSAANDFEDEEEEESDDEVMKRSFLKARSQRFMMRTRKAKEP